MTLRLDQLPFGTPARVVAVDWDDLAPSDAQKLRNLGLDEGVDVEALHGGAIGRCPMAIRVGRMTIAMRRVYACAISVEQVDHSSPAPARLS